MYQRPKPHTHLKLRKISPLEYVSHRLEKNWRSFELNLLQLSPDILKKSHCFELLMKGERVGLWSYITLQIPTASGHVVECSTKHTTDYKATSLATYRRHVGHPFKLDDLAELRLPNPYQHLFKGDEIWLLGTSMFLAEFVDVDEFVGYLVDFGRLNPVLECGFAGSLVVVKDHQSSSKYPHLPRPNYIQEVAYGSHLDDTISIFTQRGFVVSDLYSEEWVVLLSPSSRIAKVL